MLKRLINCKVLSKFTVHQLTMNDLKVIADNAILRAVTNKAICKRYNDNKQIENAFSLTETIPNDYKFIHLDNATATALLDFYKYENDFIDWNKQNTVVFSKRQNKYLTIDLRRKISMLNAVNDNLKNECYVYIYKMYNRVCKYNKVKNNVTRIKNKGILEYFDKLVNSKNFMSFLHDISYISIQGNKEYKSTILMYKLAFKFSQIMLQAYREHSFNDYEKRTYNIEFESIYNNDGDLNDIASTVNEYDNIIVWNTLIKELTDTENKILMDIIKGLKYTDIQTKYGISSKTIAKLKSKIYSLLAPNTNKLTDKVKTIFDNINKDIEFLKDKNAIVTANTTRDDIKNSRMFNYKEYNGKRLNIKHDRIDRTVNVGEYRKQIEA